MTYNPQSLFLVNDSHRYSRFIQIHIFPGSPPEWRDRATPYTVPRDSGSQFVDQNGYRMPSSTLLPLFRAVDVMVEEKGEPLDWTSVDFVTDRNGLRKLLRWINGTGDSVKEFRIDTQLAGRRTVLLNRWEKRVKEDADPTRFSFGHSFERESTVPAPGCEQSTGHHRIVKYVSVSSLFLGDILRFLSGL